MKITVDVLCQAAQREYEQTAKNERVKFLLWIMSEEVFPAHSVYGLARAGSL